jgi:hypothetical protein
MPPKPNKDSPTFAISYFYLPLGWMEHPLLTFLMGELSIFCPLGDRSMFNSALFISWASINSIESGIATPCLLIISALL